MRLKAPPKPFAVCFASISARANMLSAATSGWSTFLISRSSAATMLLLCFRTCNAKDAHKLLAAPAYNAHSFSPHLFGKGVRLRHNPVMNGTRTFPHCHRAELGEQPGRWEAPICPCCSAPGSRTAPRLCLALTQPLPGSLLGGCSQSRGKCASPSWASH